MLRDLNKKMYIKYLSNSHNIYENGLLLLSIIFFLNQE